MPNFLRSAPAAGKNEEGTASKQDDQQNREQEAGDGVADDDGAEVHTSNCEPSLIALRMPSGIEIRYVSNVSQMPSEIETGSFSLIVAEPSCRGNNSSKIEPRKFHNIRRNRS